MTIGRPLKEINKSDFENLCGLHCTEQEICDFLDVTDKTLTKWCKQTYKKPFSEVYKIKRNKGNVSLRRRQWILAESNVTMSIWLGKQYLGQTDKVEQQVKADIKREDPLSESLRELAKNLKSDDK